MLHVKPGVGVSAGPEQIKEVMAKFGVILTARAEGMLSAYVNSLLEWNKKHNLISRADTSNIWTRHILHSIYPVLVMKISEKLSFIDIGSGGGLPGIPIAILRPDLQGVLVDSVRKKTEAVRSIVESVRITNVTVVTDRVEAPSFVKQFRSAFDLAFARAVGPLPDLVTWSLPLLRKPGKPGVGKEGGNGPRLPALVALKGGNLEEEIGETERLFPYLTITMHSIEPEGIADEFFTDKRIVIVSR